MEAAPVNVEDLFNRPIRYLVPIYQRNYRWNREEHWRPLWEDVRAVADDLLDSDEKHLGEHFLGAIVLEQLPVFGRDAQAHSVIDGQQRLTTLQLLLAGTERACKLLGLPDEAAELTPYLNNPDQIAKGRSSHQRKIWPNVVNRQAYLAALDGVDGGSPIQQAVSFFAEAVAEWAVQGDLDDPLDDLDHTPAERIDALLTALVRCVMLVKIDLEDTDNAQVIFETLNGRGERLTDADLIRNHLFRKAEEEGQDAEALHQQHWAKFDEPIWSQRVVHGRHDRERIHLFLMYWLSMARGEEVPASRLFAKFKEHTSPRTIQAAQVAAEVSRYADVFDQMDHQKPDSREWWFFRRIREMDLVTVYPVLLWLFGQSPDTLSPEARRRSLVAIESFLGRRLVGRESTRSYGDVFVRLLKVASRGNPADADRRIIEALASNTAEADRWPTDEDFLNSILNTNAYRLKRSRLRMVLEAIDRGMLADGATERIELGNALWVEHLLPQAWRTSPGWELSPGLPDPTAAGLQRDHLLHTLGNLTLTTDRLDIQLSNSPWRKKVPQLAKHSALALNREVVTRWPDTWTETELQERAHRMCDVLTGVWPSPERLLAMAGEPE